MKFSEHSKYFNDEDVQIPSSTTILKLINKPSLVKWANYIGFKRQKVDDVLERSSTIGTTVHALIEKYFMNTDYVYKEDKWHNENVIVPYVDNFLNWVKKNDVEPFSMEIHTTSKMYGGTVDFYGMLNGKKTIIDFKTSKQVYETMFLQLASYTQLLEMKGNEVEQVAILIVNDKQCKIKIKSREEIEKYIESFNLLLALFYKWSEVSGEF